MLNLIKKINKSAFHAIDGIKDTFKEQFMIKFQFFYGMSLLLLSIIFHFDVRDILIMFFIWMALLSVELMNTGVEHNVDLATNGKKDLRAKRAKDSAAGASLFICLGALVVFISFFIINVFGH